jgi:hypothetical protein
LNESEININQTADNVENFYYYHLELPQEIEQEIYEDDLEHVKYKYTSEDLELATKEKQKLLIKEEIVELEEKIFKLKKKL